MVGFPEQIVDGAADTDVGATGKVVMVTGTLWQDELPQTLSHLA